MAKKKDKKKKIKKTDYKKKFKKLKVKYKKLKAKVTTKPKKEKSKKKVKKVKNTFTDHSSNYNVDDAVKKLRSLKNIDQVNAFTKGEKRVTVKRAIKSAMNRLTK